MEGYERLLPNQDPFILAANHGTRREALILPALAMLLREGRPIHFLADWNFRLIPGVGILYRSSGAITVTRKSAKPRWLNHFKPFFEVPLPPLEQARRYLLRGRSIGIFPEGTTNRDPERLLRGRFGAAQLSLETGVPILPVGIRYETASLRPDLFKRLRIKVGEPLWSPSLAGNGRAGLAQVWDLHRTLMQALAELSGKHWPFDRDGGSGQSVCPPGLGLISEPLK
jgi:1-acyl-sn-glycerol-3-phosphate acyltransferase